MEDTYLPAFRAAIVDGRPRSIMCAYNSVNGEPACANRFLLEQTLRGAWGFGGYVVSDCGAITDIRQGHNFVKTQAEAAAVSLKTGTDLDCDIFGGDAAAYLAAMRMAVCLRRTSIVPSSDSFGLGSSSGCSIRQRW